MSQRRERKKPRGAKRGKRAAGRRPPPTGCDCGAEPAGERSQKHHLRRGRQSPPQRASATPRAAWRERGNSPQGCCERGGAEERAPDGRSRTRGREQPSDGRSGAPSRRSGWEHIRAATTDEASRSHATRSASISEQRRSTAQPCQRARGGEQGRARAGGVERKRAARLVLRLARPPPRERPAPRSGEQPQLLGAGKSDEAHTICARVYI